MNAQALSDYLNARGRADVLTLLDKLGFSVDFVAKNVLAGGGAVTIAHIAMLWQGMPNKHDRKRTRQLFDALSEVGLLQATGDEETWTLSQPPRDA